MARRQRASVIIIDEDAEEELEELPEIIEEAEELVELPQETQPEILLIEEPETVLEPEPENLDNAQIFQSYQTEDELTQAEPNESEEFEDIPPATDVVLLDYFPTTTEEYSQGFRRIAPKERKTWGITQTEEEYDTIAGMAITLGVSRNTAETWIYQCVEFYPSGFLKTRHGLTTECLKVLELYRDYCGGDNYTKSRKNRFFKKLDEQREQYLAHMQAYHEKETRVHVESSSALTHISAVNGEFVDEQTQLQIQVSFERSDRTFRSGTGDYASAKIASAIHDIYKKAANLKPLVDQAIQNGLTGQDIPDLSRINKD
jgi:hypothetical protein